jgi:hypothetical protein
MFIKAIAIGGTACSGKAARSALHKAWFLGAAQTIVKGAKAGNQELACLFRGWPASVRANCGCEQAPEKEQRRHYEDDR